MGFPLIAPVGGPGMGLHFGDCGDLRFFFRDVSGPGSVAVGDILVVDPGDTAYDAAPGGDNSRYAQAKTPTAANIDSGLFGVVTDAGDGTDGTVVTMKFWGRLTVNTDGGVAANDKLVATAGASGQVADTATGAGLQKIIGIAESADSGTSVVCLFDGIHGFGPDAT